MPAQSPAPALSAAAATNDGLTGGLTRAQRVVVDNGIGQLLLSGRNLTNEYKIAELLSTIRGKGVKVTAQQAAEYLDFCQLYYDKYVTLSLPQIMFDDAPSIVTDQFFWSVC